MDPSQHSLGWYVCRNHGSRFFSNFVQTHYFSLLPVSGPVFAACLLTSYSINYLLYYLQHKVQIVEAIWWEPETRSVCVEVYNWLKLWNIEGKHYFDQDKPNVIKIPQKYLSPTLYGPKETKMGLEFDFAQVNPGHK